MKFFKKNERTEAKRLPMTGKIRKVFRFYWLTVMAMTFMLDTSITAFAVRTLFR